MNYLNSSNIDVEKILPKKLNKTTIGLSLAGFATLGKVSYFLLCLNQISSKIEFSKRQQ